jgi:hypothetical protein
LWLTFVLLGYYWIHQAINASLLGPLGGAVLDFALGLWMIWVAGGLGRGLLAHFSPWADLSALERWAGETALGLGLLSLLIFLVGLLAFNPLSIWGLLLALSVLTARPSLQGWRKLRAAAADWAPKSHLEAFLRFYLGFNLLLALLIALAPPWTFDTLTYQLLIGKLALAEGQFGPVGGSHFWGFPQLMNTLFAGHMALADGRFIGTASLHWWVGVLWLAATAGYGQRRFGGRVGGYAPAILLSATSIWLLFGQAYVDLFPALCGMLAFIALEAWREQRAPLWLMLAGVWVGLAMSAKYNALLLGLVAGVYILVYAWRGGMLQVGQDLARFGLIATLVLAPWLLRNLAFYDTPLYPFGPEAGEWDTLKREWYTDDERAPLRTDPALILPIFISPTFLGVGQAPLWSATIGPLFLLLIPFLGLLWGVIPKEHKPSLWAMFLLVGVYHLLWLAMAGLSVYGATTRFVYPMFGPLALLAAIAWDRLPSYPTKPLHLAWMIQTICLLVLGLSLLDNLAGRRVEEGDQELGGTTASNHFVAIRALEYLFGSLSQEDYLSHNIGAYVQAQAEVNRLPDGAKVLFLWETRSLYCDEPRLQCLEDPILYRWWHERRIRGDGSAQAIWQAWRAQGITHVLVWETGREFEFRNTPFLKAEDRRVWEDFYPRLEVLWEGEAIYTLYRLP